MANWNKENCDRERSERQRNGSSRLEDHIPQFYTQEEWNAAVGRYRDAEIDKNISSKDYEGDQGQKPY